MVGEEFISEKNGKFSIDRVFNDVKYNFGIFDSFDEALDYLDYLEEEGWPLEVNSQNQNENFLPNNIEEIDGKFTVFKYIMGEKITFGEYDTLEKAKIIKNNLISNAWESFEFYDRGAYGKYIRKSGDKFVVTRTYKGKKYTFGYFRTLDEAMEVREHLIETNWGDLNINHEMRLGKYITFNGFYYVIQRVIDGDVISFGFFEELEDARKQRDLLIQDNWSRFEVPDDSNRHIRKDGDRYIIYNYIDDEFQFFGECYSLDEAKEKRNELVLNNWIIPEEEVDIEKISDNVYYDGEFFTVEKEFFDEIRVFGVFKNKNRAINCEKDLIYNGWDADYAIKTDKYPYGENIVPFDYIFIVESVEDGKLVELGSYMSYEDALLARNEFLGVNLDTGSDDRLIFSVKVGKSYKNRGWSIIRDSTYDLIPKLDYEDECNIVVDGIPTKAKLNILPRIFYDSTNKEIISHLKELGVSNPDRRINVELLLNDDKNSMRSFLQNKIDELNEIIVFRDKEISRLVDVINKKNKEISDLKKKLKEI